VGAARLAPRQRWAVLSAAGIYGAIGRKVRAAGARAWDGRIGTSGLEKLGFVLIGGWQALARSAPASPAPLLSRRALRR